MAKLVIQSAKFKRDYIAASAVIIFILIVTAEIILAVTIPTYLNGEKAMATEVKRLKLRTSFDGARNMANSVRVSKLSSTALLEARLIDWNLDQLAPYLRENIDDLSPSEIDSLQKSVDGMYNVLFKLKKGVVYSEEASLDTAKYIDNLIRETRKNEKK